MMKSNVMVVLLCAGRGARFGGSIAKPWVRLGGRTVAEYALEGFSTHPRIAGGVMVVAEGTSATSFAQKIIPKNWLVVVGGETRSLSVKAGLEALREFIPKESQTTPKFVLIHDGARPFVPREVIDRLITALDAGAEAVIPVLPIVDSVKTVAGARVSRDSLHQIQTPQGFDFASILALHRKNSNDDAGDDSVLVEQSGGEVQSVLGDPMLAKITHQADLALAEAMVAPQHILETRTATGFDIHRFSDESAEPAQKIMPKKIMLSGVAVEHSQSIIAHSDGDVALHALTDAVLGLCADGDIGTHFPPDDPQWQGKDSAFFLRYAQEKLTALGGKISFIDLTILAETPIISPHRPAMLARIAEILGVSQKRISIKATTAEGLGFIGRGEGIAAQATVTAQFKGGQDDG